MSNVATIHGGELVDAPPLIPEGRYQAAYTHHETGLFVKSPRVFLHFRIVGGSHDGKRLYRAFRVERLNGRARKNGTFRVRHSSELFRQFVRVTGERERPDRIALSRLKSCVLQVSVRTVTTDSRQRELPEALRYSVVDEMLSVEAGKP
jgi:hypothetical protein